METHLSDELLELYSFGRLPESLLAPFEEHLLVCPICPERLQETDAFVTICRAAALKVHEREPSRWRQFARTLLVVPKPVWAAALAALAIAVVLPQRAPLTQPGHQIVNLQAIRGSETAVVPQVSLAKTLELHINTTELRPLPAYRLELVNSAGQQMWDSIADTQDHLIRALVPMRLNAGKYWVRLYAPGIEGELLREFGLEVSAN